MKMETLRRVCVVAFLASGLAEVGMTYHNVTRFGPQAELGEMAQGMIVERGIEFLCLWATLTLVLTALALLFAPKIAKLVVGKIVASLVTAATICYGAGGTLLHIACTVQTIPAELILGLPPEFMVFSGFFFP